jgi:Gene Transfer Agent (GTA)-like protein/putative tail protein
MATIVLAAVGASVGGAVGGSVLGLGSAVIGRAVGATFGRLIDQRILGQGSDAVATGQVDRFYLSGASEGDPVAKSFGRVRVGGQVIWASRFREEVRTSGGSGKGGGGGSTTSTYSYSVSLALGLGEGEITRVGRIWADGAQVAKDDFNFRVYAGDETQLPDAKIEAVEGSGLAPAFRGTAYVVFEDLDLGRFGNRVPQFSFEVFRRAQPAAGTTDPSAILKGVALIPGTGEYGLATTPVHFDYGLGVNRSVNVNSASGKTDFATSIEDMRGELEAVKSVSLVVSWFGDDLKCNACRVMPRVEQVDFDGVGMPWQVSGVNRSAAEAVSLSDGRPVFGGTPTDQSVIEAISEIKAGGQEVMFYPFILMDIQSGNGLGDPWSSAADQPVMPWRGRITMSAAPEQVGSPDQSAAADAEVAAFFGGAQVSDFAAVGGGVTYSGPAEWSYRRFILHYAHLCALAGGVSSFCIGSEMRSLTQIRGAGGTFPAVDAMIALAADVRGILGPDCKIGYAADWSEYFGYQPQDGSGDRLFHLDPLWADGNIDFVGIDNYMPLSDWRDGQVHADADAGSIYSLDYLRGNIAGGEGFDWYYASDTARDFQIRTPIEDGAHDEAWIYRNKDIRSWWSKPHHERIGGVRQGFPTVWLPESKPIWFTEMGCAAIDKGCNQPNAFLDVKSSESQIPYYSNGLRDDLMQAQYLRAMVSYYGDADNNPVSVAYEAPMVNMDHAHVWAWDARPWPEFPANSELWSDAENYGRGHWLNGRMGAQALGDVIVETCEASGVSAVDVSGLYGSLTGYVMRDLDSAREALQPLMLTFGVDSVEQDGVLRFQNRDGVSDGILAEDKLVFTGQDSGATASVRLPEAEMAGQVRLGFIRADGTYEVGAAEAILPDEAALGVSRTDVPIVMTPGAAQVVAERWLAEARVARETVSLTLPPSQMHVAAGDVVELPAALGGGLARIDRVEDVGARHLEATRTDPAVYARLDEDESGGAVSAFVTPVPVFPLFMDLPLLTGDEVEHAPHLAVTATPWPGSVAVYSSAEDAGYEVNRIIEQSSVIGVTETPLFRASPVRWDNGPGVRVAMFGGTMASATREAVLNGANVAAIGNGSGQNWEVFQFQDAVLVGDGVYQLSGLLRGQAGSEALMPDDWPVGTYVVLLNGVPGQINLASSARDLARHYRVGPALRDVSDGSYVHEIRAFSGIGLRPYAPAHLRGSVDSVGDYAFGWVRRTRIDGDSWASPEVPLGEAFEAYRFRVLDGGALVRSVDLTSPSWVYSAAMKLADGISGDFSVEVAQISERFGAGSFARIDING